MNAAKGRVILKRLSSIDRVGFKSHNRGGAEKVQEKKGNAQSEGKGLE